MLEVLTVLTLSAAAGMRLALPLLLIGLLRSQSLWANTPLLSAIPPAIVLGVLASWSLVELLLSKQPLWQRLIQTVQLVGSPIVGALIGLTVVESSDLDPWLAIVLGIVGGLVALVLQLVQVGWFYRMRGLPVWVIFIQDLLCIALVLLAFDAPQQGGVIVLLLLWLTLRSSAEWRRWYGQQADPADPKRPRRYKRDPD